MLHYSSKEERGRGAREERVARVEMWDRMERGENNRVKEMKAERGCKQPSGIMKKFGVKKEKTADKASKRCLYYKLEMEDMAAEEVTMEGGW